MKATTVDTTWFQPADPLEHAGAEHMPDGEGCGYGTACGAGMPHHCPTGYGCGYAHVGDGDGK